MEDDRDSDVCFGSHSHVINFSSPDNFKIGLRSTRGVRWYCLEWMDVLLGEQPPDKITSAVVTTTRLPNELVAIILDFARLR